MAFNPDEYLAQQPDIALPPITVTPGQDERTQVAAASGFDPDAYLRSTAPRAPAAPPRPFDPDAYLGLKKPESAAAPETPEAPGIGFTGHAVEFGKGLIGAPPATIGAAIQGAAVGARGHARQQLEILNAIEQGAPVTEADDPVGFRQMTKEQRAEAKAELERVIATPIQETGLYKAGGTVSNVLGDITKPAPGVTPGIVRDVGGGIGSTLTGIGVGMIPGVGIPAAGAMFTLAGTGEAVQEAVKAGASQEQIERAGRLGTVAGATDIVDALLPTLGSPGRVAGLIRRIGISAVKSAFIEGGQEGLQQLMQNTIAQGVYDPNRDLMQGVGYNALVGALSGGIVGGAIGGLEKHPSTIAMTPTEQQVATAGAGVTEEPPVQGPPGPPGPPAPSSAPPPAPPRTIYQTRSGALQDVIPSMAPVGDMPTGMGIPGAVPDIATNLAVPGVAPDLPTSAAVPMSPVRLAMLETQANGPPGATQREARALVEQEIQNMVARGELTEAPPSVDPNVIRGNEVSSLLSPDAIATGPLDLRPQTVSVAVDEQPFGTIRPHGKFLTPQGVVPGGPGAVTPAHRNITVKTVHSTTLGEILPKIPADYAVGKPVTRGLAQVLAQNLARLIPNMPIHIVSDATMLRLSPTAAGFYIPSRSIAKGGPIIIAESVLRNQKDFIHTLLHESVHAVTSNLMKYDPLITERVQRIMDVVRQYHAKKLKHEFPYGFTNAREFVAEAFTNPAFQEFLHAIPAPRDLMQQLGLEGKQSLRQAFMEVVRRIIGLPNTYQARSLLEATIRAGSDVIDAQARHIENTQKLFNGVEPELMAVPRQPETQGVYDMIGGLADHITAAGPQVATELRRQAGYADKMNWFYKWMVHAFQLGELNPRLVPLQRYLEKMRFAAVDESKINDAALRVMKDWNNIGRAQAEGLTQFIDDITNMVYRTAAEVKRKIGRKPTPAEFNALVAKYKLNTAALDVFSKINKMFDGFLDQTSQLARDEAMKITDPVQRGNAINAINANVASLKSRPYFPFMRYGRHVVLVRNAAGRVVYREHFERRGFRSAESFQKEAMAKLERSRTQLEQEFGPNLKIELDILSESSAPMVGMSGLMLDLMAQKLNLTAQQQKALEQLRLEVSPAQSFQHRMQNKSYTKGYSRDFQRGFAQYFFHGAKWYVKTKYADSMREDIANVKAGAMNSLTPTKRLNLTNFLHDHLENNFLNPAQDFITFKAGLVFYTLAYVPVSAAVNMSQVPMVSLPYLGAKFGDVRAFAALSKAIGTARNYYRKGTVAGITSDEARAINYAIQTGRLEQTLGVELASWAQGGNLGVGSGGTAIQRTMHSAVEKGMWMFSIAEKWNRRVTFAAAYQLAKSQPNNKYVREALTRYTHELQDMVKAGFSQHEAEAILTATHVVDQTQFMASQESRPRIMRGKLGTLLLYKRFMQGLMFLTFNNKRDFAPRFAVMALALGGLGGLPGYEDLKEIARLLGWWLYGKDFSVDREIRRLVTSMTDEKLAPDQILHGFARTGFGVPWLLNMMGNAVGQSPTVNMQTKAPQGPDLSRSIGPGPILPVELGKLLGPPINDPAKMFGEQSARAGGVMGGLALNFYRAIASKDNPEDFKRWELMMPRFAKNLSSNYRAYSEEKVRGKNDTAIIRYDTRDPEHLGEIVGGALGFQPRRLTAKWEELRDQGEQIKFIETQKGMILEQWAAAIRAGRDPEEMERMRIATTEFNANLPEWARGEALKSETINKSVRMKLETQQLQEAGLAKQKGRIPIIQEIQRLHPEAVIDVRKVQ